MESRSQATGTAADLRSPSIPETSPPGEGIPFGELLAHRQAVGLLGPFGTGNPNTSP